MRDCTKFYIDGQWVDPVTENTQPVENPATEETIGHISFGTKADVDKAVAAARRAFESFSQTSKGGSRCCARSRPRSKTARKSLPRPSATKWARR